MWKQTMVCNVADLSQNHIDLIIREGTTASWRLTCLYSFLEHHRRQESWDFLRLIASKFFLS